MDEQKKTQKCRICQDVEVPVGDETYISSRIIVGGEPHFYYRLGLLRKFEKSSNAKIYGTECYLSDICDSCITAAITAYDLYKQCKKSARFEELLVTEEPLIKHEGLHNADTQTEAPELTTVIVNGLPDNVDRRQSEDKFSEYGAIQSIYLMNPSINRKCEHFARITFATDDQVLKVWNAAQRGEMKNKYSPSRVTVTVLSEGFCPIAELPDNVLTKIFSCIDEKEGKLNLEKVCKRWNKLAPGSWHKFNELADQNSVTGKFDSNDKLEAILKRGGSSLKSLKLHVLQDPETRLELISKYCNNLEEIGLWFNFYDQYEIQTGEFHEYVGSIFQQSPELQRLFMAHIGHEFEFNHFQYLPENMSEIHLYGQELTEVESAVTMDLSKFHNLAALGLFNFNLSKDSLRGIENLRNLKYLSFKGSNVDSSNLEKIHGLTKLEHLEIPNCQINDDILSQIAKNNRGLKYLDISDIAAITDVPFTLLAKLQKLVQLRMNNVTRVKGTHLCKMRSLRELHCVGCSSMTDWSLMAMIESCNTIEDIYAAGVATQRLLLAAETTLSLSRLHRFLGPCIHVDQNLADKWRESRVGVHESNAEDCYEGPMLQVTADKSQHCTSQMDPQDWQGWFVNQKPPISRFLFFSRLFY